LFRSRKKSFDSLNMIGLKKDNRDGTPSNFNFKILLLVMLTSFVVCQQPIEVDLLKPLIDNWIGWTIIGGEISILGDATAIPSYLFSPFWDTKDARRVILTVETQTVGRCLTNITDNSLCQVQLSYTKVKNDVSSVSTYTNVNVSSFPQDTFYTNLTEQELKVDRTGGVKRSSNVSIQNLTQSAGILFRFGTKGFVGFLSSIKLSYFQCPEVSDNLVNFNKTSAPDIYEGDRNVTGTCTANAGLKVNSVTPRMICHYDGTYEIVGNCECKAGYYKDTTSCSGTTLLFNCYSYRC